MGKVWKRISSRTIRILRHLCGFKRRRDFYIRCQDLVDTLHDRVNAGEYIDKFSDLKDFSKAEINAFLHEIEKEGMNVDFRTMTHAMEWMYATEYFRYKGHDERRTRRIAVWSLVISIASVAIGVCGIMKWP